MTTPTQESKLPAFNQAELDVLIDYAIANYASSEGYSYVRSTVNPSMATDGVVRLGRPGRIIRVTGQSATDALDAICDLAKRGYARAFPQLDDFFASQLTAYFECKPEEEQEDIAAIRHAVTQQYEAKLAADKKAFVERQVELTMASRKRQIELEVARREAEEAESLRAEIEAELFGEPAPAKPRRKAA